jgi:hypothetical protein
MESPFAHGRMLQRRAMARLIDGWQRSCDRRVVFLTALAFTTDGVAVVSRAGRLLDSAWTFRLLERWIDYYLRTVEPEDDDLTLITPSAWSIAHRAAGPSGVPADVAMLLGVCALVNNDLPQALAEVLTADWPLPGDRLERRRTDFGTVCGVLADTVESLHAGIATRYDHLITASASSPQLATLDRPGSWDVHCLVRTWQATAWEHALMLVTAADERWRDAIRRDLESGAEKRVDSLVADMAGRLEPLPRSANASLSPRVSVCSTRPV